MRRSLPFVLLLAACATAPAPAPAPVPVVTPVAPSAAPNKMTPLASIPKQVSPPVIRVGLLSDQAQVVFPRTADGYYIVSAAGPSRLRRGFTVAAPLASATIRYAVQAGAISDLPSATAFVEKIRTETGERVDSVFDPASGLYRILVGDFTESLAANPLRDRLVTAGYGKDMLIVKRPTAQKFDAAVTLTDDEGDKVTIAGDSLLILSVDGDTVTIDNKPYRTAARLFINQRGLLNVINELNLEDYLLGVVPAEMGPRIYDELEALKAQAIAARTYAVRNLGQYRTEGYDICPGPACQAYKGFSGEEEMSSRAVRETAGRVLTYEGKPIDALYTAACGGETSDVGTMFPGRNEPYLKRVRCVELELLSLGGRADSGVLTEQQANARMFAALAGVGETGSSWSASDVAASVRAAARLTGFPAPATAPSSSRRGDVLRYLASVFRLGEKGRVLTLPEDRRYFFTDGRADDDATLAAAFLVKFGVVPTQAIDRIDFNAAIPRDELHALLLSWIREHAAVSEITGKIDSINGRMLGVVSEGKTIRFNVPPGVPVFRRIVDRFEESASVPVMRGDRVSVLQDVAKRVVAVTVQANYDGASFDRTSSFANWTRSYRADELVPTINRRNPITELLDLRPLTIDASQRVAEMEVTAEGGRKFVLRGLPVRWSLNVPDNLFSFDKTKDADGVDRYTFFGKGWGHGTGFCQVGAYGMAFRGWTADQILHHYYTGVDIVPMSSLAAK